jgi:hypothetical protein
MRAAADDDNADSRRGSCAARVERVSSQGVRAVQVWGLGLS